MIELVKGFIRTSVNSNGLGQRFAAGPDALELLVIDGEIDGSRKDPFLPRAELHVSGACRGWLTIRPGYVELTRS